MARSGIINTKEALAAFKAGGQFPYNTRKAGRSAWSVRSQLIACPAIKTPRTLEERVKGTSGLSPGPSAPSSIVL